jgi:hypothetical protein
MDSKMTRMLDKYESAGAVLLDMTDARRKKLGAAITLSRSAPKNHYKLTAA